MLTKKLPTNPSPPKLSIFWAIPWPDGKYSKKQKNTCQNCGFEINAGKGHISCECKNPEPPSGDETFLMGVPFSAEHNWIGAMAIEYKGERIRIFPDEFSKISPENLRLYILGDGDEKIYELVEDKVVLDLFNLSMDSDTRDIYGAALIDGCNEFQAKCVVMGQTITEQEIEFPPIGWFRCQKEAALNFCDEWELTE